MLLKDDVAREMAAAFGWDEPTTDEQSEIEYATQQCERAADPGPFQVAPTMGSDLCRVYSKRTGEVYGAYEFDEAVAVAARMNGGDAGRKPAA